MYHVAHTVKADRRLAAQAQLNDNKLIDKGKIPFENQGIFTLIFLITVPCDTAFRSFLGRGQISIGDCISE